MARLSFEKKRAPQPVGYPAAVPVRVFGAGDASVGGVAVVAAPGEEIQQAVLNHLQRLAMSVGTPVRAVIQDDLAGCVVPLEVSADGSSRVTGEPVRLTAPEAPGTGAVAPGTVQVPTGRFGPPPLMNPRTADTAGTSGTFGTTGTAGTSATFETAGTASTAETVVPEKPAVSAPPISRPASSPSSLLSPFAALPPEPPAVPAHTPARGFDAVAEEVLGDGPLTETAEGAELLAEPMRRLNEAVRAGRIDTAAELADRTLDEASAVFGPHHAEVLHIRELSAYIAYLADDPVRACRLSLDLARLRRGAGDGEAAYGNVRSAATAWRAVRDPEEGLRLGRDLIEVWTDLAAEPGPAADDPRPLEAARARMVRLTDRAAKATGA
ncbi:hypothetical protein [Streptomyces sp. NRRL S-31]|uniref:hypothetical protein n=1 Tax=Streptomyces sp. NRRL S-31 TaxID=1463898 RepID=UPI0004CB3BED|nr:hypothetical protein [Streptomyces sp. NRRL S-31]